MARASVDLRRTAPNAWTTGPAGPFGLGLVGVLAAGVLAVLAALVAIPLAEAGVKGLVAAAGGLALVFALLVVTQRELLGLVLFVMSLQFLLHKALGPIDTVIHSGPNALYIASIDVLLAFLYAAWLSSGRLPLDVRELRRRPEVLVPFIGGLVCLPSLLVASDLNVAFAELGRMAVTFALFVYVASRVRERRELGWVLAALALIVLGQLVVVALQLRAGGSLGFELLGDELQLTPRVLDDSSIIQRPSGTVIHPNLLGALVGPIGVLFASLGVYLRPLWQRVLCGSITAMAAGILAISQARASLLGFAAASAFVVGWTLWHGRLRLWVVALGLLALGVAAVPFQGQIRQRIVDNLTTRQFDKEVQARVELNEVALEMIADAPLFGMGLNNFEHVMDPYQDAGLIFENNPVHNIYLLFAAESGVFAAAAFAVVQLVLLLLALKLAQVPDPLLAGVGTGVAAAHIFFIAEEQLMFSLRLDMPRTLYWLLAGLSVACWRMHERRRSARPGRVDHVGV